MASERQIDFRWLNMDNREFVTRKELVRYANKEKRGQWRSYVEISLKHGILMAYGKRPYSRQEMVVLDQKMRKNK